MSPHHALVGSAMTRSMLYREYGVCGTEDLLDYRETICLLVRYHMVVPYIIESDAPERRLIKLAANGGLAKDFSLKLLFILAKADANGKISEDDQKSEDVVLLLGETANDIGCIDTPVKFFSPFTEYAYLSGKNVVPETELYNDTVCRVTLMCGLPGVGKDTFIRKEYRDIPMISLDEIRKEFGVSPAGDQNEVVRIAKARAKKLLRNKQSFVWNATSVTTDIRAKLISLFIGYHAYVTIVYLETDYETNLYRNKNRSETVPESVIKNMLEKLVPPERHEAHEVVWKCI